MSWPAWSMTGFFSGGTTSNTAAMSGSQAGTTPNTGGAYLPVQVGRVVVVGGGGVGQDPVGIERHHARRTRADGVEGKRHCPRNYPAGPRTGRETLVELPQQAVGQAPGEQVGAVAGARQQPQVLGLAGPLVEGPGVLLAEVVVGRIGHDEGEGGGDGGHQVAGVGHRRERRRDPGAAAPGPAPCGPAGEHAQRATRLVPGVSQTPDHAGGLMATTPAPIACPGRRRGGARPPPPG